MANQHDRERMVIETSEDMKRATRIRAAMDGVAPADVVNTALGLYVAKELAIVRARDKDSGGTAGNETKVRKQKDGALP